MQTKYLQRLIRQNAGFITNVHFFIEDTINLAKYFKMMGEKSLSAEEYKAADKAREVLAKAVETQKALKAELEEKHNLQRIQVLVNVLKDSKPVEAFEVLLSAVLTSGEKVKAMRAML